MTALKFLSDSGYNTL